MVCRGKFVLLINELTLSFCSHENSILRTRAVWVRSTDELQLFLPWPTQSALVQLPSHVLWKPESRQDFQRDVRTRKKTHHPVRDLLTSPCWPNQHPKILEFPLQVS